MELPKCNECKLCNRKGLPSVRRGSAYCQVQRGTISDTRLNIWGRINDIRFALFSRKK